MLVRRNSAPGCLATSLAKARSDRLNSQFCAKIHRADTPTQVRLRGCTCALRDQERIARLGAPGNRWAFHAAMSAKVPASHQSGTRRGRRPLAASTSTSPTPSRAISDTRKPQQAARRKRIRLKRGVRRSLRSGLQVGKDQGHFPPDQNLAIVDVPRGEAHRADRRDTRSRRRSRRSSPGLSSVADRECR